MFSKYFLKCRVINQLSNTQVYCVYSNTKLAKKIVHSKVACNIHTWPLRFNLT